MSMPTNEMNGSSSRGDVKKRSMRSRKTKAAWPNITEEVKLYILQEIARFVGSEETSLKMPESLTKDQRAYIHRYVVKLGLTSRSTGKQETRCITIFKPISRMRIDGSTGSLLSSECFDLILNLLDKREGTNTPAKRMLTAIEKPMKSIDLYDSCLPTKYLTKISTPPTALMKISNGLDNKKLPIWPMRDTILNIIRSEQVVIVNGETGSGKSTQLPQYILEDAYKYKSACRIICTQPRRIAAISISERVAFERGEKIGTTVGYQIRLENKFQPDTNLIYATSGCFLRSLMSDSRSTFEGITHVIIDEIHERDKNTDFVLIALREEIKKNKRLKIILMSATMNINLLCEYFNGCRVINVPGKCYETRTFFLEDILFYIKYETAKMRLALANMPESKTTPETFPVDADTPVEKLDADTKSFVNGLIQSCCDGTENDVIEHFEQLIYLIEGEGVSVDIQHTNNGRTPLMAAIIRNKVKYINILLKKGANAQITDHYGKTAFNYADQYGVDPYTLKYLTNEPNGYKLPNGLEDKKRRLLTAYQQQFTAEYDEIDHDLLLSLLLVIHKADFRGSVLIFLPGYNDMMIQKEMIERELKADSYKLFLIHGSMSTNDQRLAFQKTRVRKIILATNIAETSITFPDVAYVVDSGLVKEHVYNSTTGSSYLQSIDISKACARQRAGRAGRTQSGICYRLYSSAKFASMREYAVPEFLRVPLMEICLYTKVISKDSSISAYLSKAIEPPSSANVTNAIRKLTMIGALDDAENLTILGKRLVDIPLDVQFGKCLLYSVLLGCVNPVAIIVSYFSVKDPFLLPSDRLDRGRVSSLRKELSENSVSDHLGIIRMFQKWKRSRQLRIESRFLADYNLSKQSLEMMSAVQNQILDYVRRAFLKPSSSFSVLNNNSNDWNLIRACITAGLYPNIACIDRTEGKIRTQFEKSTNFHTTSVLSDSSNKNERKTFDKLPTNWVVFTENSRIGTRAFIRYNTVVTPLNIGLFCGGLELSTDYPEQAQSEEENDCENGETLDSSIDIKISKAFVVDEWIQFRIPIREFYVLSEYKELLLEAFLDLLHHGRNRHREKYSYLIVALKKVLVIDSCDKFEGTVEPFDDSYLPKRYDTLTNIEHFQIESIQKKWNRNQS